MLAVAWQTLRIGHPSAEVLDQRLTEHRFIPSLVLGMISYYWSMLQASEILLPPAIGGYAFWLVNFPVSLGRMVLTVLLIHLACKLVDRPRRGGGSSSRWGVHPTTMDRPDRSGRCVLGDGLPHCWDGGRALLGVRHRRSLFFSRFGD